MNRTVSSLTSFYDELLQKADPRVENYPMMSNPWASLIICLLYVFVVESLLPRFMEKRPPFEFRKLLITYNFAMVLLSGYIFMEFGLSGWFIGYSYKCQPVDYSTSPQAIRMVNVCWWFYMSKFIELFDTVFFVLRKKNNQVTFLHVFHHGIMPISWWFGVKFVPATMFLLNVYHLHSHDDIVIMTAGGFGTFHAFLNSFIHFLMYTYYGLSAMGPAYQKFIWWKKYMTSMQITQFVVVCLHAVQLFFMDCNYPVFFSYWIALYAVIFLILFLNFYIQAYRKPESQRSMAVGDGVDVHDNGFKKVE